MHIYLFYLWSNPDDILYQKLYWCRNCLLTIIIMSLIKGIAEVTIQGNKFETWKQYILAKILQNRLYGGTRPQNIFRRIMCGEPILISQVEPVSGVWKTVLFLSCCSPDFFP